MTELETILLRKIRRFKKEMDTMEDMILNGIQEGDIKPAKQKAEKYDPSVDLPFFNDNDFQEVWKEFVSIRVRKKASNSDRAIKTIINKIVKLSKCNKKYAIQMVDKSVNSGWSDVYELKDYVVPISEKKGTNTERYNYKKEAEENPEDYTKFNMSDVFKQTIKKA